MSTSRMVRGPGRGGRVRLRADRRRARRTWSRGCGADSAVIGGEGNGGVIDPRVGWVRDPFIGMALILSLMAEEGQAAEPARRRAAAYAMLKTKFAVPRERLPAVLAALARPLAGREPRTARTACGSTARTGGSTSAASNTEPVVRVIAEAPTRRTQAGATCAARRERRRLSPAASRCCPSCADARDPPMRLSTRAADLLPAPRPTGVRADRGRRLRGERRPDLPRRRRAVGRAPHRGRGHARRAGGATPGSSGSSTTPGGPTSAPCRRTPGTSRSAGWRRGWGKNFTVVTQNVDGLHQRAGSRNVLEVHGSLHRTRCTACGEEERPRPRTARRPAGVPGLRRRAAAGHRLVPREPAAGRVGGAPRWPPTTATCSSSSAPRPWSTRRRRSIPLAKAVEARRVRR